MTLINPLFLWGLALGAIPIILHLLQRRRYRVRRWAAMEFLQVSVRQTSRRLRLEQLLLLLLRVAILMLAAMALARPVVSAGGLGLLSRHAPVHATLLLDNSYSMGYGVGSGSALQSSFERARERALQIVREGLRRGDSVSVILASDPPRALIRRPTFDLAGAARQIREIPLSDRGTSFAKAARLCLETLREVPTRNREVYLITDSQAVGWGASATDERRPTTNDQRPTTDDQRPTTNVRRLTRPNRDARFVVRRSSSVGSAAIWRDLAEQARLHVVSVAEPAPENAAVTAAVVRGGMVSTRMPATIEARIANYGDRPRSGLLATLVVDEVARASTRVDLPARGEATARFTHLFATPGVHSGSVRVTADRLPRDDEAFFRLRARDQLRVLCLNGRPSAEPQQDAAFYLTHALAPGAGEGEPTGLIRPTVLTGNSFGGTDLRAYDVVILADVAALSPVDTRALGNFVRDGGGALLFLSGRSRGVSFLPSGLRQEAEAPGADRSSHVSLDATTIDHPALDRFRGAADVDLGSATFDHYAHLAVAANDRTLHVLCRFTNGLPAIVEKREGGGMIVVAASSGADGNDLPYKPAYLPLLHQLVAHLAQGPDAAENLIVGDPIRKSLALAANATTGRSFSLTDPTGAVTSLQAASLGPDGTPALGFDRTERAGLYRLAVGSWQLAVGSPNQGRPRTTSPMVRRVATAGSQLPTANRQLPTALDLFAVNLPPGEGDLRPVGREQLARLIPGIRVWWIDPNQRIADALRQSRLGVELWRPMIAAVMLMLLLESFLAQQFGRGRGTREASRGGTR